MASGRQRDVIISSPGVSPTMTTRRSKFRRFTLSRLPGSKTKGTRRAVCQKDLTPTPVSES
eukprot:8826061-Heterocapsa_arctica.AAC.1